MKNESRFHILYSLKTFRYGLLLCLVPMLNALFAFDFAALITALWQGAGILLVCAVASVWLWASTVISIEEDGIFTSAGVLFKRTHAFFKSSVAVVEVERPLYCRLLGASRLRLYFKGNFAPRSYTAVLKKADAERAANVLLPVKIKASVFEPAGYERLAFMMLSANVLTSALFAWMTVNRVEDVIGIEFRELASKNFAWIEALIATVLPAGAALVASVAFVLLSITFLRTFLRTYGFQVCRNGGVIINRGGLLTKIERRISVASVSACDVRVTPVARLVKRRPVYVMAGSFRGGDLPLMVCKKNDEAAIASLLFSYTNPDGEVSPPQKSSPMTFLWKPCTCLALSLALCGVAYARLPSMLPVLAIFVVLSLVSTLICCEAVFAEGVCKNRNRTLSVVFAKFFTRHEVCVLTNDVSYLVRENPLGVNNGWGNFYVTLPCGLRYRARCVRRYVAHHMPLSL